MDSENIDSTKAQRVDFFLHSSLRTNADLHYRARVLSLSIFSLMLGTVTIFFVVLSVPALAGMRSITLPTNVISVIVMTYLLYRLKVSGSYGISSFVFVLFCFSAVVVTGILTGGPANAPAFQLLVLPCITAYFFGGIYWGSITSIASLIILMLLQTMELAGFKFPLLIEGERLGQFVLLTNIPMVAMLALIYEYATKALKQARDLQHQKFAELAVNDPLTGLSNRRVFSEALRDKITLSDKLTSTQRFTLCYMDLDNFKPVNDRFGHAVGDEVLRAISNKLKLALRGSDFVGRIGGDEFMILLSDVSETDTITALANRYLRLISEPIATSAGSVELGGSLGFAVYPEHGQDALTLQRAADAAMYAAKHSGIGFRIYDDSLNQ